jgi:hypothetical protein
MSMQTPLQRSELFPGQSVHTPVRHFWFAAQALAQVPQLSESFKRSKQPAVHCVVPAMQAHLAAAQLMFEPQALAHAPQFAASDWRSTHVPEQSLSPPAQAHLPAVQV